jgi:hypothetical protein
VSRLCAPPYLARSSAGVSICTFVLTSKASKVSLLCAPLYLARSSAGGQYLCRCTSKPSACVMHTLRMRYACATHAKQVAACVSLAGSAVRFLNAYATHTTLCCPLPERIRSAYATHAKQVAACVSLVGSAVRFLECEQGGGGGNASCAAAGTHFACFTSTKVQILTAEELLQRQKSTLQWWC